MASHRRKKKIMRAFKINELSAVDFPAQEGATMTIMKRAGGTHEYLAKMAYLTDDAPDGHSHLILAAGDIAGFTSMNGSGEGDDFHSHPWINTVEGVPVIGASNGHEHGVREGMMKMILPEEWVADLSSEDHDVALKATEKCLSLAKSGVSMDNGSLPIQDGADLNALFKSSDLWDDDPEAIRHIVKRAESLGVGLPTDGELATLLKNNTADPSKETGIMTKENKTGDEGGTNENVAKQLEDAQAATAKVETELKTVKRLAEMTDVQKAFYGELELENASGFLALTSKDQDAEITKANEKDTVIYKAADGTEYRASDDKRMVEMAKRGDARDKELAEIKKSRADETYTKRAGDELEHLPGTVETKIEILKALDGIKDEGVRDEALKSIHAQNKDMAKAFETHGASNDPMDKSAADELDALTKKHAVDNDLTFEKAQVAVLGTDKGAALYSQVSQL